MSVCKVIYRSVYVVLLLEALLLLLRQGATLVSLRIGIQYSKVIRGHRARDVLCHFGVFVSVCEVIYKFH